jgi:hypothetical protein
MIYSNMTRCRGVDAELASSSQRWCLHDILQERRIALLLKDCFKVSLFAAGLKRGMGYR